MPRGKKAAASRNALEQFAWDIGTQLGDALTRAIADGVAEAFKAAKVSGSAPAVKRGPGRPKKAAATPTAAGSADAADAACLVPGCGRGATARGLCATHYSKARRLEFDTKSLTAAQLATLGEDGRKKK
jgi:hypothetical protein